MEKLKNKLQNIIIQVNAPSKEKKCSPEYFLLNLLFIRKIN